LQNSVGPAELFQQRPREFDEGVRPHDYLRVAAQPLEKVERAIEHLHGADHGLDVRQPESVLVEDGKAPAHQVVVVVARRAAQRRDARALGDVDPDLGHEDAFEVETRDHTAH